MNRYNQESTIIDWVRTRDIPENIASEMIVFHSLLLGAASESFCRQMEALHDVIVDFQNVERGEEIEDQVRVRSVRGKQVDSRWRKLRLGENGEVSLIR